MRKDSPRKTAFKVALNIITLGTKPQMERVLPGGIVEATDMLLAASGVAGQRTLQWARSRRALTVYEAFDRILPGQFEAFGHRKAWCEGQVRDGIRQGVSQIVVLGAGYDTMGWRLAPEYEDVTFYEIDHPATARLKAKGIEAMGRPDNLCLIAEDLGARRLADVLGTDVAWNRSAQTVVIAEGLVMYLPPDAVVDLFAQCASVTGPGSRMAFSYIPTGVDGRPDAGRWTGLMMWLQKVSGEPWLWSIRPEELGTFLESTGWKEIPNPQAAQKHGVEHYIVAEK